MTAPTTRETADHAELAACPFCGSTATIERFGNTRVSTQYQCDDCGCFLETGEEFHHGRAWNRRPREEALLSEIAALRGERERLRTAVSKSNDEICQSLGKALGYPWFKDDQANFPGSTEADGVCVGDHVAESIADEAASRLTQVERQRDEAYAVIERLGSSEAFDMPRVIDGPLAPEMRARMDCARAFIANQGAE